MLFDMQKATMKAASQEQLQELIGANRHIYPYEYGIVAS